jgi:hypothetical protein
MQSVAEDRLLTHYFRFIMREESGPLRDRLQRGLVERALKTGNPEHTMSAATIEANIEKQVGVKHYPQELVHQALRELVPRGYVERAGRSAAGVELYRLARDRFENLNGAIGRVEEQERVFQSGVVDKVEAACGHLDAEDRERVEAAFIDFVGTILGKIGEHCALNLVEQKHWARASEYPRFQHDLDHAVKRLPTQLQDAARHAFQETLQSPEPEQGEYLYSIGQVYYVVELLHLDPALQALQRERFEATRLYLDTNLLIAALLQEHDRHGVVIALLRLCNGLGFELRYSERTSEELEGLIGMADEEYRDHPPFSHEMASELALAVDSPFLRAYFISWPSTKWSWQQYRARISGWRDVLKAEGIVVDDSIPTTMSGSRYDHLRYKLGIVVADRNGRRVPKRRRAVEHDAHMLAAIETLAQRDDKEAHPFGHRYWFLTLDRRLADCARQAARSDVGGVCMLAEEWVQYISPFLGPDVSHEEAADVFVRLLASRFFVSLGAGLNLEDLQPFTAPNVKDFFEGLTREEACRAVSEAAQSEAVAAAERTHRPEIALDRLTGLVEVRLAEKRKHGELVAKTEVDQMRAQHERDKALIAESATEKDARIKALEQQLALSKSHLHAASRHVRWSPSYQVERLCQRLAAGLVWARPRWWRLVIVGAILVGATALQVEGWGGVGLSVIGWFGFAVAIFATDPAVVRKNLGALLGMRV